MDAFEALVSILLEKRAIAWGEAPFEVTIL